MEPRELVEVVLEEKLAARAAQLEALRVGAKSHCYKVVTDKRDTLVAKVYLTPTRDGLDRLRVEFGALSFLRQNGVEEVPEPVAADFARQVGLYRGEEGSVVHEAERAEVEAAANFVKRLHGLRSAPGAEQLPPASEACFSLDEHLALLEGRRTRLLQALGNGPLEPEARTFLQQDYSRTFEQTSQLARKLAARSGWDPAFVLPFSQRTLSPSDFGFHNTLRRPEGSLVFLDLEYFGWDDPVKMIADFLQQPVFSLSFELQQLFCQRVSRFLGRAEELAARYRYLAPLLGLKWCLVFLNPFLPGEGSPDEEPQSRQQQLEKARSRVQWVGKQLQQGGAALPS